VKKGVKLAALEYSLKDMLSIHPQYIKDSKGNNSHVVLPAKEFKILLEELEELEDIRIYDLAKANDKGERILFSDYLKQHKNG
jgi:hypothetical protein